MNEKRRKIKFHLGNILIIIGIIIFSTSMFLAFRWKDVQNKYINKYNENIIEANEYEVEEPALVRDESYNNEISYNEISLKEIQDEKNYKKKEIDNINRDEYEDGMMIIDIPKIEVKAAVMSGTSEKVLKKGPGLYEVSSLPYNEGGNVLIAGHRTTYGAWFHDVDKLEEGDVINIEISSSKFTYKVEKVFLVASNDWSVTEPTGYSALTLTSCHPLRSNKQRIIVRAKLEKVE